jgi:hypothetical protein
VFNDAGSSLTLDQARQCFAFTTGICCTFCAKSSDGKSSSVVFTDRGYSLQERLVEVGSRSLGTTSFGGEPRARTSPART